MNEDDIHFGTSLLQVAVLKLIQSDPERAYGWALADKISEHRVVDSQQVYMTLQRLKRRGFVIQTKKIDRRIFYEVTEKGIIAVKLAEALLTSP
jgi:DNA-binding PadR family transcriptional regulator